MIHSKKLTLGICLVLLIILIGGCVIMTKTNGRNAQIKENFNKTLSVYPRISMIFTIRKVFEIKNLIKEIKGLGLFILKWLSNQKGKIWNREEWCSISIAILEQRRVILLSPK